MADAWAEAWANSTNKTWDEAWAEARPVLIAGVKERYGFSDEDTIDLVDNQIQPRILAGFLAEAGVPSTRVRTYVGDQDGVGFPVTCAMCGKTGQMPMPVAAGQVAWCPPCGSKAFNETFPPGE